MRSIKLFLISVPALFFSWSITRYVLFLFITLVLPYPEGKWLKGDVDLYNFWAQGLVKGIFPINDSMWQYPPLAGVVFATPQWVFGNALTGFIIFMIIFDLLVLITLLIFGLKRFSETPELITLNGLGGAWFWVLWPVLMGPLALTRFDVVPTFFAVVSIILISNPKIRPVLSGVFLSIGALVKLWPLLLLVIYPRKYFKQLVPSFILGAVGIIFLMNIWSVGFSNFLANQQNRGLQVESVAGSIFVFLKLFGLSVDYPFRYGSLEVDAVFADELAMFLYITTLIMFIIIFVFNYQNRLNHLNLFDKALVIVLISITLSRVFSPQFWVWVGGLAALALISRETKLKKVITLLVFSVLLTQLLYPGLYVPLLNGEVFASIVQILRVVLFVWAVVIGTKLLFKQPVKKK